MSEMDHIKGRVENAYSSGEPGTTGREPFENSTASGPGKAFSSGTGVTGTHGNDHGLGGGLGSSHDHRQHQQHEVVDSLTSGTGHAHEHEHGRDHSHTHGVPSAGYGDKVENSGAGTGTQYGTGKHGTEPQVGLGGGGLTRAAGGPATQVGSGVGHRDHGDLVGGMGQDSSKYEGDLHSGPRTTGAAGTDRFDSDRTHSSSGIGSGLDRKHDDGVHHDTSQRAPGRETGGLSGILATSDKDFTDRERQGKGAYADTDGPYSMNTSGPADNTALTGREGNLANNPVSHGARDPSDSSVTNEPPHRTEHKGFLQKVKDAIS